MAQLLKAELYKLVHQKSFPGLLVFSLLLGSVMMLDRKLPASAADCFSGAFSQHNIMPALCGGGF